MKSKILTLVALFIFIGCSGTQPSPQVQNNNNIAKKDNTKQVKEIKPKEQYEKIISYQDIISKINDINTKKKSNKRVKEIIKEYQYNTSDDDSKNSARKKALTQVKILILEEIGVFVESYLEINKIVADKKYQKYFKQEIKNLTAGIIKTKILDEKYDGNTYYVKASVLVDPDSVSEGISEILKIKANKSEISKLQKLLQSKEQEIDMRSSETITLQKKITKQELINRAKEEELKAIQKKLYIAERQLQKYNIEENRIRTKLDKILNRISTQTNDAINKIYRGMTKNEVKSLIGNPVNDTYSSNWVYGRLYIKFEDGVVGCISKKSLTYSCEYHSKYDSWAIVK